MGQTARELLLLGPEPEMPPPPPEAEEGAYIEGHLHDHGLFSLCSTDRAHVCSLVALLYIFGTREAREAVRRHRFSPRVFYHRMLPSRALREECGVEANFVTNAGWVVPVDLIPGLKRYHIPSALLEEFPLEEEGDQSEKGENAVLLTQAMLEGGFCSGAKYEVQVVQEKGLQLKGIDLVVGDPALSTLEVKCDRRGGAGEGGTGRLYLQTCEVNLLGQH